MRIDPPDEYQPKFQEEMGKLETTREEKEYGYLEKFEKAYNTELKGSGKKIKVYINT